MGAGGGGDELANIETTWNRLDALVYSPAISAGVSFVGSQVVRGGCSAPGHFHTLIVYARNTRGAPPVHTVVQMTARVRCFNTGVANVFLDGARPGASELPLSLAKVREMLREGMRERLAPYVACEVKLAAEPRWDNVARRAVYDEWCFNLLVAILLLANRSAAYYRPMLLSAFRECAYNVVEMGPVDVAGVHYAEMAFITGFPARDRACVGRVAVLTDAQMREMREGGGAIADVTGEVRHIAHKDAADATLYPVFPASVQLKRWRRRRG
jgi:hypothetical protein